MGCLSAILRMTDWLDLLSSLVKIKLVSHFLSHLFFFLEFFHFQERQVMMFAHLIIFSYNGTHLDDN
jgi:hypothetical protein